MFSHKVTKGYNSKASGMGIVSHVNDVPVKNLVHLVELLRDNTNQFVTLRFANTQSERLVFDKKEIETATEDILSENGIRAQCSDDLKEVWEKKGIRSK